MRVAGWIGAIMVVLFWAGLAGAVAAAEPGYDLAITVDDLPAHSVLPKGVTRLEVAQAVIAALEAHQAPQVYGFVNGLRLEEDPSTISVLKAWRAAGFRLGNHSYSHMDIVGHSVADYQQDLERNEPLLRQLMGDEDWRYWRSPFLRAGETPDKHAAVAAMLKAHGYRLAEVTMGFDDWAYGEAYARCADKGDAAQIAALETNYLDRAVLGIARSREASHRLFGRDAPQVLLLHIGAFERAVLPRLLDRLQRSGAHFVTLPQAEADPAYGLDPDHAGEGQVFDRLAGERGLALSVTLPSLAFLDGVCR